MIQCISSFWKQNSVSLKTKHMLSSFSQRIAVLFVSLFVIPNHWYC
jgi:hypothetical protein